MALPLGKLTLIVGAGLFGSALAKEGRILGLSDIFSGASKIKGFFTKQDGSSVSNSKPKAEILMQQINSLRSEIQMFASSNKSLTIVNVGRSGTGKYSAVVIVIVVGYGYLWWKGYKISDMMFATRRSLNDACTSVAKQLETVYSSIADTKNHLSGRINSVDSKVEECLENTSSIKEDVPLLRGGIDQIGADVQSIHHAVRFLETKICSIEGRQDDTIHGLHRLVTVAAKLENNRSMDQIEDAKSTSPLLTFESPQASTLRTRSLPGSSTEPPSPSHSNGPQRSQSVTATPGLKELAEGTQTREQNPAVTKPLEQAANNGLGSAPVLGRTLTGRGWFSSLPGIQK